jgi:peptidylprolyl isomerase
MTSVKRYVLLALTCVALPATATLAQPKAPKPKAVSPLAGQPFKPKLDEPTAVDWRTVDPENLLVIDTTKGRILVEMIPEMAPKSVARIKELAREHFYDGLTWHRVVDGFMAQGGDPKGDGSGGSTKPDVPAEFTFRRGASAPYTKMFSQDGMEEGFFKSMPVLGQSSDLAVMTADGKVTDSGLWCTGVAGMARSGDPDSANSQFYLMRDYNAGLQGKYTPWGRVLVGEDVVRSLKTGEPVTNPDKMTSVRVAADLPPGQQPKVQVVDASGPWFKTAAKYADDACGIDLPARLVN